MFLSEQITYFFVILDQAPLNMDQGGLACLYHLFDQVLKVVTYFLSVSLASVKGYSKNLLGEFSSVHRLFAWQS